MSGDHLGGTMSVANAGSPLLVLPGIMSQIIATVAAPANTASERTFMPVMKPLEVK